MSDRINVAELRVLAEEVRDEGGEGAPAGVGEYDERQLACDVLALLDVAEAARGMTLWDYVGDADPDAYRALTVAVARLDFGEGT